MILDNLENEKLYESVHPRFRKAFDFIKSTDLLHLPIGKIELDGSKLYVSVVEIEGKSEEEAKMETHKNFIDIQVPVDGEEIMGWKALQSLKKISQPYDSEKDIAFYSDKASNLIKVQPGEFVIFFPTDGHQPGIFEGKHKKIIVKVLV